MPNRSLKTLNKINRFLASLSDKDPMTMTSGQINKTLDRLDEASSQLIDIFIEEGRGYELPSDTVKKGDPLSNLYKGLSDSRSLLRFEISRRYGPGAPRRLPSR